MSPDALHATGIQEHLNHEDSHSPDAAHSVHKGSVSLQSSGLMALLWSIPSSSHSG